MRRKALWSGVALAGLASGAMGQEFAMPDIPLDQLMASPSEAKPGDESPHPSLPHDARWGGIVLLVAGAGILLPAMFVGPVVRSLREQDEAESETGEPDGDADAHAAAHGH